MLRTGTSPGFGLHNLRLGEQALGGNISWAESVAAPDSAHPVQVLTGQRRGGAYVQATTEALPAIYSVKSAKGVVKNTIAFLPRRTLRARRNHRGPKKVVHGLKDSMFSSFRTMRDGQNEP